MTESDRIVAKGLVEKEIAANELMQSMADVDRLVKPGKVRFFKSVDELHVKMQLQDGRQLKGVLGRNEPPQQLANIMRGHAGYWEAEGLNADAAGIIQNLIGVPVVIADHPARSKNI